MFELTLLLSVLAAFGLLVSALLPLRLAVMAAIGLCVLQLYTVSTAGVYMSVAHLAALALWRHVMEPATVRQPWFMAVACLLFIQIVSAIWSPSPVLAIRYVLYSLPFLLIAAGVVKLARVDFPAVRRAFLFAFATSALQALLIILFRVLPSVELAFLYSPVARFFISANLLSDIANGAYTVFDPGKAGGLFINANVAAVFSGVMAFAAWGCAALLQARWLRWIALLNLLSVFFTGSKAGMGMAVLMPALLYLITVLRSGRISMGLVATACFSLAGAVLVAVFIAERAADSAYVDASGQTMDERLKIWRFAWQVVRESPVTGLGFGGWELKWPAYAQAVGSNPFFPPHNAFLALFMQSGLTAALAGMAFALTSLAYIWRRFVAAEGVVKEFALCLLVAQVWLVVQAQGENYGLIGEVHLTLLMAGLMGMLVHKTQGELARGH